jgi:hypothetical protein
LLNSFHISLRHTNHNEVAENVKEEDGKADKEDSTDVRINKV